MGKIIRLQHLFKRRDCLEVAGGELLSEIERIAEVWKTLVNTGYPFDKTLERLEEIINGSCEHLGAGDARI